MRIIRKLMHVSGLIIVLSLVLGVARVTAQMESVVPNSVAASITSKAIIKDGAGNYYVTYSAVYNGYSHIFVRKSSDLITWQYWDGTSFVTSGSSEMPIESIGNYAQSKPTIEVDSGNNVYVLWYGYDSSSASYTQIKYSKYNGSTWGNPVNITSGNYNQSYISIAVDSNNNVYAVWYGTDVVSPTYTQIRYSKYDGSSWSTPSNITTGNYFQSCPSIAADNSNNMYVLWYGTDTISQTYNQIRFSKFNGSSWSTPTNITSENYNQYNASMAVDGNNNIYAVWYGTNSISQTYTQIRYSKYNGSAWSSPANITTGNYYQYYPTISVDSSNNICAAWHGKDSLSGSINRIRYSKFNGSTWGTPIDITTGSFDQKNPSLVRGEITVCWQGTTDSSGISSSTAGIMECNLIVPSAGAITGNDISDNGDGRDVQVAFNGSSDETNVSEYRIILIKSKDSGTFGEIDAETLTSSKYLSVATSGNISYTATFNQTSQDSSGTPIVSGEPYKIFVLAVAKNGYLNKLSSSVNCLTTTVPSTGAQKDRVTIASSTLGTIAKDSSGNYYVVYETSYNGYQRIFIRKSDDGGQTWKFWNGTSFNISGFEVPIESSGIYSQYKPSIAIDSLNNVYVVWYGTDASSPTYTQIRYSKFDGSAWSGSADITSGNYNQNNPSITADGNNNIYVVWYGTDASSPTYTQVRYSKFDGSTWSGPADITLGNYNQNNPSITIDNLNNIYAVWYGTDASSPTYTQVRYSKFDGSTWSGPLDITSENYNQLNPSIAVDSSNNVYVAWNGNNASSPIYNQIRYIKFSGSAWSEPLNITSGSYDQASASIVVDEENNVFIVWYGKDATSTNCTQIRYVKYDGTSWSSSSNLTSGEYNQSNPSLAKNEFTLTWQGVTDSSGISSSSSGIMFYFNNPIASPTASPSGGTYNCAQNVILTSAGNAVSTFYTLDGSNPDNTKTAYVGAININGLNGTTITLKAVSYDSIGHISPILTQNYVFDMVASTAPTANPAGGTYNTAKSVTLTQAGDAATTYYTLDGSNPDNTKTAYTGTILIDGADGDTVILKVVSYDAAGNISIITTENYIFDKVGPTAPTASPAGGTYSTAESVSLNPAGDAVSTYYTLDGSTPNNTKIAYTGAISIDGADGTTKVLKAVSYDAAGNISTIAAESYVFDKVGPTAPTASPAGGTYNIAKSVTLNSAGDAVATYYTLDGSAPDNTKIAYTGAILIDGADGETVMLKAVSYDSLGNIGTALTQNYTFDKVAPTAPIANPAGGTYNAAKSVTLTQAGDAATTYYTLDGSNPDNTKTAYTGTILIDGANGDAVILKVVSYDAAGNISTITTENYVFDKVGPTAPTASPAGGTYSTAESVSLNPAGDAVSTYYTLDGSTPNNTKTAYTGAISIDGADGITKVLKAVSYDAAGNISAIAIENYVFDKVGPIAPTASPIGGTYNIAKSVTLNSAGDAVSTYYTLDGSAPDNTKTAYTGAISIDEVDGETVMLKVVSYDSLGNIGTALTQNYTFDKVAPTAPIANPAGGTYNTAKSVTLTQAGDVATTYYTLDGSDPDNTKAVYTGTISIDGADGDTVILKVVSYDAAGNISTITTENYIFDKVGPTAPTASPAGGTYSTAESVSLNPAGDAVSTYYTLDGSIPNNTKTAYTGAISIDGADGQTVILKAVSYDVYGNIGTVLIQNYVFDKIGTVAPIVNPVSGIYNIAQSVTLTPADDAVSTYYTLDGSAPDNTKTAYLGAISIDGADGQTITLKAVSYDVGGNIGTVAEGNYVFDKVGPTSATADPKGGTYNIAQSVTLTPAGDAVSTYYTLDGSAPDNTKTKYNTPIIIDGLNGTTVRLMSVSYDALGNKGSITTEDYSFNIIVNSGGGSFSPAIIVVPDTKEEDSNDAENIQQDETNIIISMNTNSSTSGKSEKLSISQKLIETAIEKSKNIIISDSENKIVLTHEELELLKASNANGSITLEISRNNLSIESITDKELKPIGNINEYSASIVVKDELGNEMHRNPAQFEKGVQIEISYSSDAKKVSNLNRLGVYIKGNSGQWEYVRSKVDKENKKIIFNSKNFGEYAVMEYNKKFKDVPNNHWAKEYIDTLIGKHITDGVDESHFAPEDVVTRAQFAAFIVKTLNVKSELKHKGMFSDVKANTWYGSYVETAAKLGIVDGVGDYKFEPDNEITREEMTVMIMRAYQYATNKNIQEESEKSVVKFDDMEQVSDWAKAAVAAAKNNGIINGMTDTMFMPKGKAQRAQVAKMLVKLLNDMN